MNSSDRDGQEIRNEKVFGETPGHGLWKVHDLKKL
jgi:hypothetical protein